MNIFIFDALAGIMAAMILVMAAIILSFSRRYMDGEFNQKTFYPLIGGLSVSVLVLVVANHVLIFAGAWAVMGLMLSRLIGHMRFWGQARAASGIALRHFAFGTLCLTGALLILAIQTGQWSVTGILSGLEQIPVPVLWVAGSLLLLAAMVQSALFPFHRWLLASMNAPTPVSGFMHAGLVNAGGFLIVRFSGLFSALPDLLLILFALGALTALLASSWMLCQNDIKRVLGCSTSAQMGFMIAQCGLGFYSAAIAHLILHGFYKAYQFLAAGSAIAGLSSPLSNRSAASEDSGRILILGIGPLILTGGVLAAAVFAGMTEKTLWLSDSGSVLIFFAALAGIQASTGLAAMTHLAYLVRLTLIASITSLAAAIYAVLFNLINDALPVNEVQPLSFVHIAAIVIFALGWLGLSSGLHKKSSSAYVKVLNSAQPPRSTVLTHRSDYRAG